MDLNDKMAKALVVSVEQFNAKTWLKVMIDLDEICKALDACVGEWNYGKYGIALLDCKPWLHVREAEFFELVLVSGDRKKIEVVLDRFAIVKRSYPILVQLGQHAAPLENKEMLEERFLAHVKSPVSPLVQKIAGGLK